MPAIPTQPDDGFPYPDDLSALSAEELAGIEQQALDAFDELAADDNPTDQQVAEMERLAGFVQEVRAEGVNREQAAQERVARVEAARAAINPPEDTDAPVEEPAESEGDLGDEEEAEEEEETTDRLPVAAAARSTVRTMRRAANPRPRANPDIRMTAGADISGYALGSRLEGLIDVAKAFMARSKGFVAPPAGRETGVWNRYGVATITKPHDPDGLYDTNKDFDSGYALIDLAKRESRLPGGSLTAAGGWCAPSETIYTLCQNETIDGILDTPEMTISRGGIRFTPGPDFADIYGDTCFFHLTEAQVIAGTAKTCCTVDCPDFDEVRLDAVGFCVKAPILTRAGFPELVQRWLEGTIVANAHKVNATKIAAIATALGTATPAFDGEAVTFSTLTALELAGEGIRYKYRMSRSESLEAVAPIWLRAAIRADLSNRTGQPLEDTTDAQIQAHFAARGIAIQWVYDWQDTAFTAAGCVTAFPTTAEVLLYPAGTFVVGTQDVISLDTIYDTTDLLSNIFTAAFVEDGLLVAQTCFQGCRLTIPVCVSGRTAAADLTGCYGVTTP